MSAVVGFLTGTLSLEAAWIAVQTALASMTIRDGITTENAKNP